MPAFRFIALTTCVCAAGIDPSWSTAAEAAELTLHGSVVVTIQPPEAVADGARWNRDGGPAQTPGVPEADITPGAHTVSFENLANWREPPAGEVFVIGGRTSQVAAVFTPIPAFDLVEIPAQQARQSDTLEFVVNEATSNLTLQVTATPPPTGPLAFDAATGRFTYTPAAADRLPFSLTFSTGGVQAATTIVTPLPNLPNEEITINYSRPLPDEESRDYINISETQHPPELFNDATNATLSVDISGKTLVFAMNHPANLHRQYSGRENIKEFRLFADRVIIRSPLLLLQTHVSIHARELRFEGDGLIDTTPRARMLQPPGATWEDQRTAGINGDAGHHGGDVDVFVERFHADPTPATRFILRGGNGGAAGEGRDGFAEGTFSFLSADWHTLMARAGNPFCGTVGGSTVMLYHQEWFDNVIEDTCGSRVTAHGEPAVRSGVPGGGGQGGTLHSTLDLSAFAELGGGTAGTRGHDHTGGTLSARQFIYRVTRTRFVNGQEITTDADTTAPKAAGANATAPIGVDGAAGSVEVIPDTAIWLHSFSVRSVVEFAKDAYLDGHTAEARALLAEYRDSVRALQPVVESVTNLTDAEFAETTSLDQLTLEMDTLIHRIDSNLDFFGNPAGWVPMLSFEANLVSFQHEIDQSIPILYLAYWLNYAATNLQNSLAASGLAVDKLKTELADMITAYNQAQLDIPPLKVESDAINARINLLNAQLAALLQQLLQRAEQNVEDRHKVPFWKKGIGLLAVAADLIPVGQPVVGGIGNGIQQLSQVDPNNPLPSAASNTNFFDIFSQKNITTCFSNSSTNSTNSASMDKQKQLSACGKFLGGELQELAAAFRATTVDKKEVEAELAKLKASDPVFQQITTELEQLNDDKETFGQKLAAALQTVGTLTSAMTENTLATQNLESRVAQALTVLDHNALLHIKEMERRAKDRLLTFQYFVAQAFQYRVLQPYSGNLHLNRLFDRFQELVEGGSSHVLSQEEFANLKSLYLAELRDTVAQTLVILNANAPDHSLPVQIQIIGDELQRLNTDGQITINLRERGVFPSSHENIRISDLRTVALTAHPVGGSIGSHALVFLDFEHQGISRITSGGQTFLFRHYQTADVNPITWNTVFDAVAGSFSNSELSPAAQSLLNLLLDQPTTDNLLLFSLPAADADIVLRKEVQADIGIDLAIDSLVIQVTYDFSAANSSHPPLSVVVTDDLDPVIAVSQTDLNGRRDGEGDFRRVFPSGAVVTLEAPASYGGRLFDRWAVNNQQRTAGVTSVTLTLTSATTAEARLPRCRSPARRRKSCSSPRTYPPSWRAWPCSALPPWETNR